MITVKVIQPSMVLQPYVQHYWIMRTCDTAMSQLIMPMGCLKWIFHRKRPFDVNGRTDLHAQAQAVGPYDKAIHVDSTEYLEMITVFFQPYAAKLIMDIPGREFCNGVCDFDNLENIGFRDLKARIIDAPSAEACIELIEQFVTRQLIRTAGSPYTKPLAHVLDTLMRYPAVRVEELTSAACLCERQFRRVFADHVGMNPKQFRRILRFRLATNAMICSREESLDALLCQYGFTDHSHFNRDFHDIAGLSPTQYIHYLERVSQQGVLPAYRSYHAQDV